MNFIRELFSRDEQTDNIIEENRQLKIKRKHTSKEMDALKAEKDEIVAKYIELLEEKAKGFDQYLYYHDLYGETYTLTKEQKKEIAELKGEVKRLNEEVEELTNDKTKQEGKIERLKKKLDKEVQTNEND